MAAHQEVKREWWLNQRGAFDLYYSEAVRNEAAMGSEDAAALRLCQQKRKWMLCTLRLPRMKEWILC